MNKLYTALASVCIVFFFLLIVSTQNDQAKIRDMEIAIDSLRAECYKKDKSINEATGIAIQLSDRLNQLYESHPDVHREIFSK